LERIGHIGLVCPEISGHLNPMTTLGRELKRRGYAVSVVARPDASAKAEGAGLGFLPVGEADYPVGSMARTTATLGEMKGAAAVRFTVQVLGEAARVLLQDMPAALAAGGVDALIVDQVSPSGGTVAEKMGLPFVTVCNALALHSEPDIPPALTPWQYAPTPLGRLRNRLGYGAMTRVTRPIVDLLNAQRAEWGLPRATSRRDFDSPLAQIAQQPAFFDFPRRELPDCFHYTGPFHDDASGDPTPDFPWDRLNPERLLIYASMGTLQNRLRFVFHAIAAACADLDAQLVLSLGGSLTAGTMAAETFAGDPIAVPYAPQLALLKRATLIITHAGLNTALESLRQGVPMVAIPVTNDQPGVAARLTHLGAAEVVPLRRVSAERLRTAIRRVLAEESYRQHAQAAQREMAVLDGVRLAADIVEGALSTRRPVRPMAAS
jgi:MGT family glycosyltransferase